MEVTTVVVLAGGDGRRMGGGKPLRPYGATTLVSHAVGLARMWSDDVAVAVRDPQQVGAEAGATLIFDDAALEGPIAGLASALRYAQQQGSSRVLTLPCDAPLLPTDLLSRLETGLGDGDAVAVAVSGGRLHPACALWRTECLAALPAYLATRRRSLKAFAAACGMSEVEWEARADDPFANANTPEDLAALQPPP